MTDLKQLLDSYNLCARFAPGFLFIVAVYFLLGYDIETLQDNSVAFLVLLVILSGVCGFISSSLIKFMELLLWKVKHPTICYLKLFEKKLYEYLFNEHKSDSKIITYLLKTTRDDKKLFWKNISYGFFKNSILLSLACLYFSYPTEYFYKNIFVCIVIIFMTFICSFYYAEQAIKSYQENTCKEKKK